MHRSVLKSSLGVAAFLVVVDRLTKIWAEANLELGTSRVIVENWLEFKLAYNPGAAFSFLTNATWVFTIISSIAVIWISLNLKKIQHAGWAAAVGGVLGGAAGNLIDRFIGQPGFFVGHVVDFLHVPNIWLFQIFNIADASLFVSVAVLMIMSLRGFNLDGTRETRTTKEVETNE
jgi:signal peptidase II